MIYFVILYILVAKRIFNIHSLIWYYMFVRKKQKIKKRDKHMNIKLKIRKKQLEILRMALHLLLNFKKPTDKIVVSCSQQLDEVIVKYHKIKVKHHKIKAA